MLFRLSRTASAWMPGVLSALVRPRAGALPADVLRWKRKALRQEVTIARLQSALERAEARSRDLHTRLEERRHSGLSHGVLRQVLPIRASRVPCASHDAEVAAARDAALQCVSPAYRAAVSDAADPTPLHRVEIDGVRWWVPIDAANRERVDRAQRQGFPYRAILQTRELAIGGFMLDIGANIGRTSIPRVVLGDVRGVYAAEPEPANYACLVRNVLEHRLRGVVLPDCVAIGDSCGDVLLRRSKYPGGHRVLPGAASPDGAAEPRRHEGHEGAPEGSITVRRWTLDGWMGRLGIDAGAVTFVKVDTQGSEVGVLRGAASLLARPHVSWLVEVDPDLLRSAGTSVQELVGLVQRHFSHVIDIGSRDAGPRVRSTAGLAESLAYLGARHTKTDLLLFHAA